MVCECILLSIPRQCGNGWCGTGGAFIFIESPVVVDLKRPVNVLK